MPTIALTALPAGEMKRAPLNVWAADIQAAVNGLDGTNFLAGALAADHLFRARVSGDSDPRLAIQSDGKLVFGSGSGVGDATLSRSAASKLSLGSDDTLVLGTGGIEFSDASKLVSSADLSYVEFTTNKTATATTGATANTIVSAAAVTLDGATRIKVEFFCADVRRGTSWVTFNLYDGATQLGDMFSLSVAGVHFVHLSRFLTPSAAAHTYHIKGYVDAGTGEANAGAGTAGVLMPGYIRVTRA